MGFIRGFFLVTVSVLLFFSLFIAITFGILGASLTYDNVQNKSISIAHNLLQQDGNLTSAISKNYPYVQIYCQTHSNYIFNAEGYTFNISCSNALKGENELINEGISSLIHQIYYSQYNCNFLDCFKSNEIPVFLISEKMYNYLAGKSGLFSAVSFVLFILLFLLTKKKINSFIIVGAFFIIPSLAFLKMDVFFNTSSNKMIIQFLELFLSQSFPIALKILISGIFLVIFGIVFKIFNLGFLISEWISKMEGKSSDKKQQNTQDKKPVKNISKSKSK